MSAMTAAGEAVTEARTRQPIQARTDRRAARAVVWVVLFSVPVLTVVAVALHLHNGSTELTRWWYGTLALALTFLVPGTLLATRRPHNPIGWLMLSACLAEALCSAGREYLILGVTGGSAPGWLWTGWFCDSLYVVAIACMPTMLVLFPGGHIGRGRSRALVLVPALGFAAAWSGYLFTGDVAEIHHHRLANPAAHLVPQSIAGAVQAIGFPLLLVSLLVAVIALITRYRRSSGELRNQLKWVVWAGTISSIELVTEFVPGNDVANVASVITDTLLAAAITIAILRHRLLDIDLVINRTLVFVTLSVVVVGGYLGLVVALSEALGEPVRVGPGLAAAAAVAVAFAPVRSFVQARIDRLMFGQRSNPYGVVTQLGRRLESSTRSGELAVVVDTISTALKLPYAAIFATSGQPLASIGTAAGPVVERPLAYQGTAVGHLLVSHRAGSTAFSAHEERLLTDLSRQVGAAVHAVRLSSELQASRERLVSAKEEERRRLRRDLHDGLGPKLAAVGLKLDASKSMIASRPDEAKQVLSDVRDDVRSTIEDIRRLVYELRPPALDELGLVGALRDCVGRFELGRGPEFHVRAPADLPPLPAAVEVAAYRIVNEAVTNVIRHADARVCEVFVTLEAESLNLTIADDGIGGCGTWRSGVGTASMTERAAELGGTLDVMPAPSGRGTSVQVALPVTVAGLDAVIGSS